MADPATVQDLGVERRVTGTYTPYAELTKVLPAMALGTMAGRQERERFAAEQEQKNNAMLAQIYPSMIAAKTMRGAMPGETPSTNFLGQLPLVMQQPPAAGMADEAMMDYALKKSQWEKNMNDLQNAGLERMKKTLDIDPTLRMQYPELRKMLGQQLQAQIQAGDVDGAVKTATQSHKFGTMFKKSVDDRLPKDLPQAVLDTMDDKTKQEFLAAWESATQKQKNDYLAMMKKKYEPTANK
jgi:hypothetical protein